MNLDNVKILIGDDSILARKQLKDVLITLGATNFIEASNGQEAYDKYVEESPNLVFIDIVMPVKDGITAIHDIVSHDPHADIIVVSSVGTQGQLKSAIEAGAKDFIQKPLSAEQIQSILEVRF